MKKSELSLEPIYYSKIIDGKKYYWSIRLIFYQGQSLFDPDRWFVEQKWGRVQKPEAQSMELGFENELKARKELDKLVYLKEQEGYTPVFK